MAALSSFLDFSQVEGAFVQGIGFFTNEEYTTNSDGLVINGDTWTYNTVVPKTTTMTIEPPACSAATAATFSKSGYYMLIYTL